MELRQKKKVYIEKELKPLRCVGNIEHLNMYNWCLKWRGDTENETEKYLKK